MSSLSDLSDQYPDITQIGKLLLNPYGKKHSISGEICTVSCADDNSIVKSVLKEKGESRVLVVDAVGVAHASMVGDQIAESALLNNWAGIVINGFVRDIKALKTLELAIFARGSVAKKTDKQDHGFKDIMISFGGVVMRPGHWIYIDENGWLVSDRNLEL